MIRAATLYAIVGVALCAAAFAARAAFHAGPDRPSARGSQGIRPGTPVAQDPAAIRALVKTAERFARDCVAVLPASNFWYPAQLDAVGYVRCKPIGAGGTNLLAYRFAEAGQDGAELDDWIAAFPLAGGPCDGGSGITRWNDRRNRPSGGILCTWTSDSRAYVVWNERATRSAFVIDGTDLNRLLEWWSTHVRPQPAYPTAAERGLLAAIGPKVSTKDCYRDPSGGSPTSTASVICNPAKDNLGKSLEVDELFYESFASQTDLDRHIDGVAALNSPSAGDDPNAACDTAETEREPWDRGERPRGTLLCWSDAESRHLGWSLDASLLYGELSRNGGDIAETYATWYAVSDVVATGR